MSLSNSKGHFTGMLKMLERKMWNWKMRHQNGAAPAIATPIFPTPVVVLLKANYKY